MDYKYLGVRVGFMIEVDIADESLVKKITSQPYLFLLNIFSLKKGLES